LCGDGLQIVAFLKFTCLFQVLIGVKRELALQLPNAKEKDKQKALANHEVNIPHPSHEIPPLVKALKLECGHFQQCMVGKTSSQFNFEQRIRHATLWSIGRANLYI